MIGISKRELQYGRISAIKGLWKKDPLSPRLRAIASANVTTGKATVDAAVMAAAAVVAAAANEAAVVAAVVAAVSTPT